MDQWFVLQCSQCCHHQFDGPETKVILVDFDGLRLNIAVIFFYI